MTTAQSEGVTVTPITKLPPGTPSLKVPIFCGFVGAWWASNKASKLGVSNTKRYWIAAAISTSVTMLFAVLVPVVAIFALSGAVDTSTGTFNNPDAKAPLTDKAAAPAAVPPKPAPAVSTPENLSDRLAIVRSLPMPDYKYVGKPLILSSDQYYKTWEWAFMDAFHMGEAAWFQKDPRYLWGTYENPVSTATPPSSLTMWNTTGEPTIVAMNDPTDATHLTVQALLANNVAGKRVTHDFEFKLELKEGFWLIVSEKQSN